MTTTPSTSPPPSVASSAPQPQASPKPSTATSPKNLLFICTIALLLAALGYFGYQNWQLQQEVKRFNEIIKVDNTPYEFSTPTPSSDPATNWKEITRSNWQFKVPPNWNYWECNADLIFVGPNIPKDQTYECAFDGAPGVIQINRLYSSKTPQFKIPEESSTNPLVTNKSNIVINNKTGIIQLEEIIDGQGQGKRWVVYIRHSSEILDIISLHDAEQKQTSFDQILSTFKFLDSDNETACTQDSDCDIQTCDCEAKNKNFIDFGRSTCTVECGTTQCVNQKCTLIP